MKFQFLAVPEKEKEKDTNAAEPEKEGIYGYPNN